jgi:hypothetical protein
MEVHSFTTSGSSGTAPFNSHSINPSFPSSGFQKDAPTVVSEFLADIENED